jgi:hypothetical protein
MLEPLTIAGMVGNVVSVVGVVIMNKYIVSIDKFNYMIFLSFMHLVFTYLGCSLMLKAQIFTYKPATVKQVLPVAMVSNTPKHSASLLRRYTSLAPAPAPSRRLTQRPLLPRPLGSLGRPGINRLHEPQPVLQLSRILSAVQAGLHPRDDHD